MPLIHVQDVSMIADNLRDNIIKYLVDKYDIPALSEEDEYHLYNYIFLTMQNYMLNPPPEKKKQTNLIIIFLIILISIYIIACLFR